MGVDVFLYIDSVLSLASLEFFLETYFKKKLCNIVPSLLNELQKHVNRRLREDVKTFAQYFSCFKIEF